MVNRSIAVLCVEKMATAAAGYVYQTSLYQLDYLSDVFSIKYILKNHFNQTYRHQIYLYQASLIFSTDFVFQTISVTFFAIWLTKPFSIRPIPINLFPSSLNISHQPRCILLDFPWNSSQIYPTCFLIHITTTFKNQGKLHRTKPLITETAFFKCA